MKAPVRTTLFYGAVMAILLWPVTGLFTGLLGWPAAFKLMLWVSLSGYAILLAHWSCHPKTALVFPLTLLLGIALWPGIDGDFFIIALGVLSWVRSGICFSGNPLRAVVAETITIAGGAALMTMLNPGTAATWSLGIWLFALFQSLYFFIVPPTRSADRDTVHEDLFERAYQNAMRILDGQS